MLNNLIAKITYKLRKKEEIEPKENVENEDRVFIYDSNGVGINPKYITPEQYKQLLSFEKFVKNHDELSDEQLTNFIKRGRKIFINELNDKIPNFVSELRKNGAKAVALIYISDKLYFKEEKKDENTRF